MPETQPPSVQGKTFSAYFPEMLRIIPAGVFWITQDGMPRALQLHPQLMSATAFGLQGQ